MEFENSQQIDGDGQPCAFYIALLIAIPLQSKHNALSVVGSGKLFPYALDEWLLNTPLVFCMTLIDFCLRKSIVKQEINWCCGDVEVETK